MTRFKTSHGRFGTYETVVLEDTTTGSKAAFVRLGGPLLAWHVPFQGKLFDVTDGFATPEELAEAKGGRAWIMAPWTNRIDGGQYEWGGARLDLGVEDPVKRVILHGFVKRLGVDVESESADDAAARVTFSVKVIRTGGFRGYPFDVDILVAYALKPGRLEVEVTGRNVGMAAAPFCSGWHPYFKTPSKGIDGLKLTIPAKTKIVSDARLLPMAGEAARTPIEKAPEFDFRPGSVRGNLVGSQVIDASYADLAPDADGWLRTRVEDPATGMKITVFQERGLMHVFTGDTLGRRPRNALALEPIEVLTNAFNRPECRDAITLAPGAERTFRFGVEVAV
jgi:aldose 1-epimerase